MKRSFLKILFIVSFILLLFGCEFNLDNEQDKDQKTYEIFLLAKESGYVGTYEQWLESIKGEKGDDGHTPEITIGENGNWYIDGVDTNVSTKANNNQLIYTNVADYNINPGNVKTIEVENLFTNSKIKCKTFFFPDGEYIFDSTINLISNISIIGSANTIFKLNNNSSDNVLIKIENVDNVKLSNINLYGSNNTRPIEMIDKIGIYIDSSRSVNIDNLNIAGWNKCGLYGVTMSSYGNKEDGKFYKQLQLTNSRFYNNYYGTYFDYRCEYSQVLNCVFGENYIGSLNCGGNNIYNSCMWNANTYGFVLENNGSNPAHGTCSSSTFNHNYSHAVKIEDCVNGWSFTGCQIFYGKVELINSIGVIFDANIWGSCSFISVNNRKNTNLISDTYFLTNSNEILKQNDGSTAIKNCLPNHISNENEICDKELIKTFIDKNNNFLPLSTNAYSGAARYILDRNIQIDYVDFITCGGVEGDCINGINIWVVNAETKCVTEQLVKNIEAHITYSNILGEYVVRIELNKKFDYPSYFIVKCTRENGISIAYYYSGINNSGYLVGDINPEIGEIINTNTDIIPAYVIYQYNK